MDRGAWQATVPGVTESDMEEVALHLWASQGVEESQGWVGIQGVESVS